MYLHEGSYMVQFGVCYGILVGSKKELNWRCWVIKVLWGNHLGFL